MNPHEVISIEYLWNHDINFVLCCLCPDQMLDKFLAEQREKQAALKKKRVEGRKIETAEASLQCCGGRISKPLTDMSF